MPLHLKTPCNHRGCRKPVRGRYCDDHQHLAHRRPSDERRGTAAERGYDHRWRKVRQQYIRRYPLCEDCLDEGILNDEHLEVDHVIPIEVRPDLRLSLENLRTRCRRHHTRKTLEDERNQGMPTS